MRDQEIVDLQEAYLSIYTNLDERRYDRDEPLPGSGKTPREKMQKKRDQHAARVRLGNPALGRSPRNDPERDSYFDRASMMDRVSASQDRGEEPRDDEGRKNLIKARRRPRASYERQDNRPGGLRAGNTKAGGHRTLVRHEEFEGDLFDYLLEYLVAEGYADTNKAALVIMANMSEEWRQNIVERGFGLGFLDLRKPAAKPKAEPTPKPPTVDSPGGAGGQVTVDKPYPATLGGLKGVKSTDERGYEYFQPYTSSGRKEPSGKPFEPTTMPDANRAQYKNTWTNTYKDIPARQSTKNPQSHISRTGVPRVYARTATYGIDD